MQYRKLGTTDIEVSTICQGCWSIVGGFNWGEQDRNDSIQAIRTSMDCGVTFYDTAPAYGGGSSEELLAEALDTQRNKVVIATKVSRSKLGGEDVRTSCETSLKRLKRDVIDLLQLHWPNPEVPVAESIGALEQLRQEGKIRAYGVSNFGEGYLGQALQAGAIQSNQIAWSLLFRAAEFFVEPTCRERNVSILCYSPIMQGLLADKFNAPGEVPEDRARTRHFSPARRDQARHGEPGCEELTFDTIDRIRQICSDIGEPMARVAMAWLLSHESVASVLAGARNANQARDNAAAGDLTLSDETVSALNEATAGLKDALGSSMDMWQTDSRAERD
jgi:aryl-alcohol dehydrogenase-like predicted oxidoreductase